MALLIDTTNDNRDMRVNKGIFALGVAMLPSKQVPAMRGLIEQCQGGDWTDMPYDIARVLYEQLQRQIDAKLPYLKRSNAKLIEWMEENSVLTVTLLGEKSLRTLASKIALR